MFIIDVTPFESTLKPYCLEARTFTEAMKEIEKDQYFKHAIQISIDWLHGKLIIFAIGGLGLYPNLGATYKLTET